MQHKFPFFTLVLQIATHIPLRGPTRPDNDVYSILAKQCMEKIGQLCLSTFNSISRCAMNTRYDHSLIDLNENLKIDKHINFTLGTIGYIFQYFVTLYFHATV